MLHLVLAFLLTVASVTVSPALGEDKSYRDPRQPSFTLLVPNGWALTRTEQGVNLANGTGYAQLGVLRDTQQPGAMLVQVRTQIEQQYKNFREIDSGGSRFGGQKGLYGVYSGIPPSGVNSIMKVVTMNNGQFTYILFMGAHTDEYDRLKRDMDRIESSFSPDPVR
jgi:hypothetical protein